VALGGPGHGQHLSTIDGDWGMGHATHFLERLERLAVPEVELALGLYRDTPLLRYVLDSCNLPEGAEKVALALREQQEGPHLIVTREGRFVTCLGAGMSTGELPVVRRGQLDALSARGDGVRERIAEADALAGGAHKTAGLLGLLFTEGMGLSREQFRAISVWQPMLQIELLVLLLETYESLATLQDVAAHRKVRRHRERNRDIVDKLGKVTWAMAYLTLLVGMGPRSFFEELSTRAVRTWPVVAWQCYRLGMNRPALMATWTVGKAGKSVLPDFKAAYREASLADQFLSASMGLAAIGLRHQGLRAEVLKALRGLPHPEPVDSSRQVQAAFRDVLVNVLDYPEYGVKMCEAVGGSAYAILAEGLPEGHALRHLDPMAVPGPLACAAATYAGRDFHSQTTDKLVLAYALPWLASIEAEELFLPEPLTADLRYQVTKQYMANSILDNHLKHDRTGPKPVRREQPPGRNAPCPCGSGGKYKRCCGVE